MSAAEDVRTRARRTGTSRFLRSELALIFRRRRNQAGLLVLAGVPVLISIAVKLSSPGRDSGGPDFFSSIKTGDLPSVSWVVPTVISPNDPIVMDLRAHLKERVAAVRNNTP